MIIGNHTISKKHEPFIVAEMSGNHNKSLDRAIQIVEAAAESEIKKRHSSNMGNVKINSNTILYNL